MHRCRQCCVLWCRCGAGVAPSFAQHCHVGAGAVYTNGFVSSCLLRCSQLHAALYSCVARFRHRHHSSSHGMPGSCTRLLLLRLLVLQPCVMSFFAAACHATAVDLCINSTHVIPFSILDSTADYWEQALLRTGCGLHSVTLASACNTGNPSSTTTWTFRTARKWCFDQKCYPVSIVTPKRQKLFCSKAAASPTLRNPTCCCFQMRPDPSHANPFAYTPSQHTHHCAACRH